MGLGDLVGQHELVDDTWDDARLLAALRCVPDAVLLVGGEGRLSWANAAAERMFGWPLEEWVGVSGLELIHPEDLDLALLSLASVQGKEVGTALELRVRTVDGWRLVELVGAPLPGEPAGMLVLSLRDLTERRRWEVAGDHVARFRSLMHNAAMVTMLVSGGGRIDAVSGAFTRLLGHDPETVQGVPLADLLHPEDRPLFAAALARSRFGSPRAAGAASTVEVRFRHRVSDRTTPFELTIVNLLDDPTVGGFVISGHDITRLRTVQDQLKALANRDGLTGLPNRAALDEHIAAALGRVAGDEVQLSVAFIDLDRFKPINDLLGHSAGDELLCHLAARLQGAVRDGDLVARFGGDEFIVVTEGGDDEGSRLAERLEEVVAQPFQLSTGPAQIFASVGVATAYPGHTVEALLRDADAEMYTVKRGRRASPREPVMARGDRRVLAEQLAVALAERQLVVHYQPIMELSGSTVVGYEALVRWNHPQRGLLQPAAFLSVAEDAGLESQIDNFVLRAACAQLVTLDTAAAEPLCMSVNLSIGQLAGDGFVELVQSVLSERGLAPERLCFEITERRILERPDHDPATPVQVTLDALAEAGVRLAIDDFGTGYSTLTHVLHLPIQILKIDRSFIAGITMHRQHRSIVAAIIELAKGMGIDVVAKGVEHPDQLIALRQLGCSLGQGYLLGRPSPASSLQGHPLQPDIADSRVLSQPLP